MAAGLNASLKSISSAMALAQSGRTPNKPTEANVAEESLLGRLRDIIRTGYAVNDFYGDDVSALDVPELHRQAQLLIARSRHPRVFLLMDDRFRGAVISQIMTGFGCRVTLCFDGRDAYLKHLKRRSNSFDVAILQWDMGSGIGGREVTRYLRDEGLKMCVIAIVGQGMLPGDSVRGGASLFLRQPLVIHMHVLRQLLLPTQLSMAGFPAHVLAQRAHFGEMANILRHMAAAAAGAGGKDDDFDQLMADIMRDWEAEDSFDPELFIENLRESLKLAAAGSLAALSGPNGVSGATAEALQQYRAQQLDTVKSNVGKLLAINNTVKRQLGVARLELTETSAKLREVKHGVDPAAGNSTVALDELDALSRHTLKERYIALHKLNDQRAYEISRLTSDCEAMLAVNASVQETLDNIARAVVVPVDGAKTAGPGMPPMAPADVASSALVPPGTAGGTSGQHLKPVDVKVVRRMGSKSPQPLALAAPGGGGKRSAAMAMSLTALRNKAHDGRRRQHGGGGASMHKNPGDRPFYLRVKESLECQLMLQEDIRSARRGEVESVSFVTSSWSRHQRVMHPQAYERTMDLLDDIVEAANDMASSCLAVFPPIHKYVRAFADRFHEALHKHDPIIVFAADKSAMQMHQQNSSPLLQRAESHNFGPSTLTLKAELTSTRAKAARGLAHHLLTDRLAKSFREWMMFTMARRGFIDGGLMREKTRELNDLKRNYQKATQQAKFAQDTINELRAQLRLSRLPSTTGPMKIPTSDKSLETDDCLTERLRMASPFGSFRGGHSTIAAATGGGGVVTEPFQEASLLASPLLKPAAASINGVASGSVSGYVSHEEWTARQKQSGGAAPSPLRKSALSDSSLYADEAYSPLMDAATLVIGQTAMTNPAPPPPASFSTAVSPPPVSSHKRPVPPVGPANPPNAGAVPSPRVKPPARVKAASSEKPPPGAEAASGTAPDLSRTNMDMPQVAPLITTAAAAKGSATAAAATGKPLPSGKHVETAKQGSPAQVAEEPRRPAVGQTQKADPGRPAGAALPPSTLVGHSDAIRAVEPPIQQRGGGRAADGGIDSKGGAEVASLAASMAAKQGKRQTKKSRSPRSIPLQPDHTGTQPPPPPHVGVDSQPSPQGPQGGGLGGATRQAQQPASEAFEPPVGQQGAAVEEERAADGFAMRQQRPTVRLGVPARGGGGVHPSNPRSAAPAKGIQPGDGQFMTDKAREVGNGQQGDEPPPPNDDEGDQQEENGSGETGDMGDPAYKMNLGDQTPPLFRIDPAQPSPASNAVQERGHRDGDDASAAAAAATTVRGSVAAPRGSGPAVNGGTASPTIAATVETTTGVGRYGRRVLRASITGAEPPSRPPPPGDPHLQGSTFALVAARPPPSAARGSFADDERSPDSPEGVHHARRQTALPPTPPDAAVQARDAGASPPSSTAVHGGRLQRDAADPAEWLDSPAPPLRASTSNVPMRPSPSIAASPLIVSAVMASAAAAGRPQTDAATPSAPPSLMSLLRTTPAHQYDPSVSMSAGAGSPTPGGQRSSPPAGGGASYGGGGGLLAPTSFLAFSAAGGVTPRGSFSISEPLGVSLTVDPQSSGNSTSTPGSVPLSAATVRPVPTTLLPDAAASASSPKRNVRFPEATGSHDDASRRPGGPSVSPQPPPPLVQIVHGQQGLRKIGSMGASMSMLMTTPSHQGSVGSAAAANAIGGDSPGNASIYQRRPSGNVGTISPLPPPGPLMASMSVGGQAAAMAPNPSSPRAALQLQRRKSMDALQALQMSILASREATTPRPGALDGFLSITGATKAAPTAPLAAGGIALPVALRPLSLGGGGVLEDVASLSPGRGRNMAVRSPVPPALSPSLPPVSSRNQPSLSYRALSVVSPGAFGGGSGHLGPPPPPPGLPHRVTADQLIGRPLGSIGKVAGPPLLAAVAGGGGASSSPRRITANQLLAMFAEQRRAQMAALRGGAAPPLASPSQWTGAPPPLTSRPPALMPPSAAMGNGRAMMGGPRRDGAAALELNLAASIRRAY
mgnify:FL=1